jgi:hypothetical protein
MESINRAESAEVNAMTEELRLGTVDNERLVVVKVFHLG